MSELRKDPIVGRWVIVATERAKRPMTPRSEVFVPGDGLCELARYDVPTSHELEGRERCDGFVWRVLPR